MVHDGHGLKMQYPKEKTGEGWSEEGKRDNEDSMPDDTIKAPFARELNRALARRGQRGGEL